MTPQEVSTEFKVSVKTVRRRISDGTLRAERVGPRLIRIRADDVDALFRPIPSARMGTAKPSGS